MTTQDAKKILEGLTEATDDQIAEANQIISGIGQVRRTQQAAKLPPSEPPWQQPIAYPNSQSGFNSQQAGTFLLRNYVIDLQYDKFVFDINYYNEARWFGGEVEDSQGGGGITGDYAAYKSWRQRFVEGTTLDYPPTPHARKVPCSLFDFYAWWESNEGQGTFVEASKIPLAPFTWQLAPKISSFDFDAALKAKQDLVSGKTGQPGPIVAPVHA